jgi:hypothetical protein
MIASQSIFHPIIAGEKIPGDWYAGIVPANIEVGENTMTDSSFCFKHFFSILLHRHAGWQQCYIMAYSNLYREHGFISIGQ